VLCCCVYALCDRTRTYSCCSWTAAPSCRHLEEVVVAVVVVVVVMVVVVVVVMVVVG
jgi:hypothetical protein